MAYETNSRQSFLLSFLQYGSANTCLKQMGFSNRLQFVYVTGCVSLPVLCGRDVVSSLVDDVEMSVNLASPSPSVAEGNTPSSASLSFLPGSSGKTYAI